MLKATAAGGIYAPSLHDALPIWANDKPELSATLTGHTYTDTLADDTFADVSGTLRSEERRVGKEGTYWSDAGVAGTYLAGAYDSAKAGTYGTLYLNSTSGAYKFVANDAAIEGLNAGNNPSLGFTLKVTAGGGIRDWQVTGVKTCAVKI